MHIYIYTLLSCPECVTDAPQRPTSFSHSQLPLKMQKKKKNMQILLPLGGHAHLAEPGYLCTKQALGACASKLLENGLLGTRRRTSYSETCVNGHLY